MSGNEPPVGSFLPGVVREASRLFGGRRAIVDPDGTALTYERLQTRSDEVAAGLSRKGIGAGDVVALTLPSVSRWVVAYVAASKIGAITSGVNPRLTPAEQAACLERVEPRLVLSSPDEVDSLAVAGETPGPLSEDPDRAVAIVFTSGTTGSPKGAWFTDRQLRAVARYDTGCAWGGTEEIPQYAATQFAHVGFTTKLPWYLMLGTTTHLLERWRPGDVLDLIERERVTTLGGVAAQLAILLRDPSLDDRDLSCVSSIVMGGAASPPSLVAEARKRLGAKYSIRWSSTESGGIGTATDPEGPDSETLHSVGRARPGSEVQIRDGRGTLAPNGEVGDVWLRSEAVMSGYWGDPEATAGVLVDGWLRTGDLGSVDVTGLLTLAGRQGEMYIRGGYNVFPSEVANVLVDDPRVTDAVVIPRAHPVLGEIGVAVVVARDPADPPTLDDLREAASGRLAGHKLPEDLVVVDALPLTPMQKVDRKRLTRIVQADSAR